jgi:tetratricopeptide (TPR) repeat protein
MSKASWRSALVLAAAVAAGCGKGSAEQAIQRGDEYASRNATAEAIIQYRLALDIDPKRADVRTKLIDLLLQNRQGAAALREAVMVADLQPNDVQAQVRAGTLLLQSGNFEDARARADKALSIDPKSVEALVLKGNSLAGLKEFDTALEEFQEAIAIQPSGDHLYVRAGAVQYARGDRKAAEEWLRKAIDVAPRSAASRVALAGFLWADSRLPEAESVLKQALALDSKDPDANRALGLLYVATGRGDAAEPHFRLIAETSDSDQPKLALADYYVSQGKTEMAKPLLTTLAAKPQTFEAATLRLAAIEATQNNTAAADSLVESVLRQNQSSPPARILKMRLAALRHRSDDVMTLAASIVANDPNSVFAGQAEFAMGVVEISRDRFDDARRHFNEALRLIPQSPDILLALAHLNLRSARFDEAETFARQLIAVQPENPQARAVIVRSRLARNDEKGAAAELAHLQRQFPNSVPVLNLTGARHLAAGRLEQARAMYAKAWEADPQNLESLDGLLAVDLQLKRPGEAVSRVENALGRLPKSSDLLVIAGKTYVAAGDLPKAEALLLEAIEREPNRLVAYNLLAQLYIDQKRLADARDKLRDLLTKNPRSVSVNTMLGTVLHLMNDTNGAEQQYQRALGLDPTAAVAANNLAWHYVSSRRNLDQALQLAQTAFRALPEDPHINDTLGWAYYHKGMYDAAVRHLEQSVSRSPKNAGMQYRLGMAHARSGNLESAVKALKTALSLSNSFDGVEEARKTLGDLGGGTTAALTAASRKQFVGA